MREMAEMEVAILILLWGAAGIVCGPGLWRDAKRWWLRCPLWNPNYPDDPQ
jgi:hypothetical protein